MKGLDTGEGEVAGGSAGQGGAAQAAATQHKEAGNALFKQRRYGAAVQRYQQGVETLQAVLAAGPAGGSAGQRQLLTDLLNNLGLTLVRQAEAEPAGRCVGCVPRSPKCSLRHQLFYFTSWRAAHAPAAAAAAAAAGMCGCPR